MTIVSEYNAAGQKDGRETLFYYNGSLAAIRQFKAGLREGRTVTFFTPTIFTKSFAVDKIIYFRNDKQHGKFYSYFENGNIEYLQRWQNGSIIGNAYFFDDKGRLKCQEYFGAKEKIISFICYDSLGRILAK